MENVPNVHGKKNIDNFNAWIDTLSELGYHSTWADINSKDFGVPQNRKRTFMVSTLSDAPYVFPSGFPLELKLKDVLESTVDEKYYLSDEHINHIKEQLESKKDGAV